VAHLALCSLHHELDPTPFDLRAEYGVTDQTAAAVSSALFQRLHRLKQVDVLLLLHFSTQLFVTTQRCLMGALCSGRRSSGLRMQAGLVWNLL